jgi:hypothetical protein
LILQCSFRAASLNQEENEMAINHTNMVDRMADIEGNLFAHFDSCENYYGEKYWRKEFDTVEDLESFFVAQILYVKGYSSKAIGTVLLVFEKHYG